MEKQALQKKELSSREAVLNGIAWDPEEDVLYLTGTLVDRGIDDLPYAGFPGWFSLRALRRPARAEYETTDEFVASHLAFVDLFSVSVRLFLFLSELPGKLWPRMYKVKLREGGEDGGEEVAEGPILDGSSDGNARA